MPHPFHPPLGTSTNQEAHQLYKPLQSLVHSPSQALLSISLRYRKQPKILFVYLLFLFHYNAHLRITYCIH